MRYRVTLIDGDGIGPEVTRATCHVLEAAGAPIEWEPVPAGQIAFEKFGRPLPEEAVASIRRNRVGLKGPLTTGLGTGMRSVNVALRKEFDLYANLRPARTY